MPLSPICKIESKCKVTYIVSGIAASGTLDFNFKTASINIPIDKQYKNQSQVFDPANTNISFRDIALYFRITSAYYEDIASYQEMITVLEYIQQQNVI
jgi:hypothetical protein